MESELEISVSHDLAPKLDGAVLDFGQYNKMQRFVWASPACGERTPMHLPSLDRGPGRQATPCLDDAGTGLTDL
nr:hypothetical protein [Arthrobacter sp. Chr15]